MTMPPTLTDRKPYRDEVVVVVRGRNVKIGLVGKVFCIVAGRVGLKFGDGGVAWTSLDDVEVIDHEECKRLGVHWSSFCT